MSQTVSMMELNNMLVKRFGKDYSSMISETGLDYAVNHQGYSYHFKVRQRTCEKWTEYGKTEFKFGLTVKMDLGYEPVCRYTIMCDTPDAVLCMVDTWLYKPPIKKQLKTVHKL